MVPLGQTAAGTPQSPPMDRARFQLLSPYPQETMAFVTAVERAGRLVMAARHALAAAQGLTVPSWRLLAVISRARHGTRLARIASLLRISRQAVREMACDLRERGLLAMPREVANRKETCLILTPEAYYSLAALDETMHYLLRELTSEVPRETLAAATVLLNGFAARLRRCETILGRRL